MPSSIKITPSCAALKIIMFSMGIIFLGTYLGGCVKETADERSGEKEMAPRTIEEVLKEHTDEWMSIAGVVGTAIGKLEGQPCIKVLVVKETEELTRRIPSQVEGFPVVIQGTGEIRALESD